MKEDKLDKTIVDILHKQTENTSSLKDETFKNIIGRIDEIEKGGNKMKRKSKVPKIASLIIVSLITITALIATTETGQAAIGKVRELLAPEKEIQQELEGQKEEINLELEEKMDYIIYIDKNYYYMESKGSIDKILPIGFPDDLPEVSMIIEQRENESPDQIANELMKSLTSKFEILERQDLAEPIPSVLVFGHGGSSWDSVIQRYYLVDNTKGGTFVITQTYFLEASEGHGVRFDNLLKEFKIIPSEED
ncbi:hypothetical protein GC105_05035 [Alkalibaculum sp. M08DMB]|uniref:Uncharacterized protein n=1 Tax=Alkalibaculum sporogenes TaxID=2655001 RepID=A0A6A7K7R2_9FIRM|nr:hypothetical protein [Alkalibaculum sporogenes]MPW25153.1 hypothetical protein [Alkalibaculum sporogenes]